jgi:alanine dehydrogenase
MDVGIPRELKDHEYRVAVTPAGVRALTDGGHRVLIERGAGEGSSIRDAEFERAGAGVLGSADEVWGEADLILKVKEPIAEEFPRMRADQVLFTYLHLAASRELTEALCKSGITAVAYETVELPDRRLPLLAPMSEVAGPGRTRPGSRRAWRPRSSCSTPTSTNFAMWTRFTKAASSR